MAIGFPAYYKKKLKSSEAASRSLLLEGRNPLQIPFDLLALGKIRKPSYYNHRIQQLLSKFKYSTGQIDSVE